MGIKWNDVKIRCGLLTNKIYIGKAKKDKDGLYTWIDRSEDKTEDCVKAVMEHMLGLCKDEDLQSITFTMDGICTLTLENLVKPEEKYIRL